MPTRKQRKRIQKERRHEYETVWVDSEGNELEEPPDDVVEPAPREKRADGKPKSQQRGAAQRRPARIPQPASWRRSIRRGGILGVAIIGFMYFTNSRVGEGTRVQSALVLGVPYTGLFIVF